MAPTKLQFRGTVDVTNSPSSIVAMNDAQGNPLPAGRRTDNVALSIPLPMILRIGALVRPTPHVAVELDVNYQAWSTTHQQSIYFEHNYPFLPQPGAQMNDIVLDQSYRDTITVRLGTEVTPFDVEKLPLKLRGGVLYDQSPIDDRHFDLLTPDSDKWGLSLGAGYALPIGEKAKLGIDLSYMHLFFAERDIGPKSVGTDATYKQDISGTDRTILNKPASSFFYGITRVSVDLFALSLSLRI
jgi:long-subunit fatty acid transport protein